MEEVKSLRRVIIKQLKEGSWTKNVNGFYNDHFFFYVSENGSWVITIIDKSKSRNSIRPLDGDKILLKDVLNIYYFHYLRYFFVKKSIKNNNLELKNKKLIEISSKFLSKNKDLCRDVKINEILK